MSNTLDTPMPPATSLSPWMPEVCNPAGTFSGDGTTDTLSVSELETIVAVYTQTQQQTL